MSEKRVGRPGKVFRCAFVISTMILRWQRIGLSLCRQSLLGACPWRPQQEVKSLKDDKETRSSFNLLLLTYWAENVFLTLVRKRFLVPSNSDHVEVLNQGGPLTDWFSKYYIYLLILIMHSDKYLILLKYNYTLQIKRYVPYHLAVLSKL